VYVAHRCDAQVVDNLCRNHNLVVLTPADRQAEPLCITVLLKEPQPRQHQQYQHAPCCHRANYNSGSAMLDEQYTCTSPPSLKMSAAVTSSGAADNDIEVRLH
jgi:hypothetical protein